jgi:uncharacterized protein
MSGRLPHNVQPMRLAETGAILHGKLLLSEMDRLAEHLHDTEGSVEVDLEFGIDEAGTRYVRGRLQTVLHLVCQRCLQVLAYPLDLSVLLALASSGHHREAELAERYEALTLTDPTIELKRLVEDELMLALPLVPAHAVDECDFDRELIAVDTSADEQIEQEEVQRPFAGLADLLKKRDS